MQPSGRSRRRFYIITAGVFAAIVIAALGIVLYYDYSYVNVEIAGNDNAYFVLSYDSTSVTLNVSESATIAVLPHADVTVTAVVSSPYAVSGWTVTGATYTRVTNDSVSFMTGSGDTTIQVSIELVSNSTAGPASPS